MSYGERETCLTHSSLSPEWGQSPWGLCPQEMGTDRPSISQVTNACGMNDSDGKKGQLGQPRVLGPTCPSPMHSWEGSPGDAPPPLPPPPRLMVTEPTATPAGCQTLTQRGTQGCRPSLPKAPRLSLFQVFRSFHLPPPTPQGASVMQILPKPRRNAPSLEGRGGWVPVQVPPTEQLRKHPQAPVMDASHRVCYRTTHSPAGGAPSWPHIRTFWGAFKMPQD